MSGIFAVADQYAKWVSEHSVTYMYILKFYFHLFEISFFTLQKLKLLSSNRRCNLFHFSPYAFRALLSVRLSAEIVHLN